MARRGRPPHPGPLTPAEERVLACVREGMPNAEIAVRLGVSVNTVRYHVSNLLAKAGAASREELGPWRPSGGDGGRSGAWFGWLAAKPVAVVVGMVAVMSVGVFFLAPLPAAEEAEPVELPEPFTRPDADELRAQGFVDVGPFLRLEEGGDPVLGHSPRELFTAVRVAPGDLLVGERDAVTPRPFNPWNYWFTVTLRMDDVRYYVDVQVPQTRGVTTPRPRSAEGGAAIQFSTGPTSVVYLSAYVSERGELGRTWLGDGVRVTLTEDGHLWLNPEPVTADLVYDELTGALLDTESAAPLGRLESENSTPIVRTVCGETYVAADPEVHTPAGTCSVRYLGTLAAPMAGVVSCDSDSVVRLDADDFSLTFVWANTGPGGDPRFDCTSRQVAAGEAIGNYLSYVVTAQSAAGRRLSLGASPEGHLFAGDFLPALGCPCRDSD